VRIEILERVEQGLQELILEHRKKMDQEAGKAWTQWCKEHAIRKQRKLYDWVKRTEPLVGTERLNWGEETNPGGVQERVQRAIEEWGGFWKQGERPKQGRGTISKTYSR